MQTPNQKENMKPTLQMTYTKLNGKTKTFRIATPHDWFSKDGEPVGFIAEAFRKDGSLKGDRRFRWDGVIAIEPFGLTLDATKIQNDGDAVPDAMADACDRDD